MQIVASVQQVDDVVQQVDDVVQQVDDVVQQVDDVVQRKSVLILLQHEACTRPNLSSMLYLLQKKYKLNNVIKPYIICMYSSVLLRFSKGQGINFQKGHFQRGVR